MSQFWSVGRMVRGPPATRSRVAVWEPSGKAGPRPIGHPAHVQRFLPELLPVCLNSDIDVT